jgi:uncharacterized cupredoxin-like copper-binding protein
MESPATRTFAMKIVTAGCVAMVGTFVYFLVAVVLPAGGSETGPLVGLSVAIITIFAVVGLASYVWSGARRRAWFWLVAAMLGLAIVLLNAPYLAYDILRPTDTVSFLITLAVLGAAAALVAGGIAAFLDVRRGRVTWSAAGRAGYATIAFVGILVGAGVTSLLAGQAAAGGGGVSDAPSTTDVLSIAQTRFVESGLTVENGEVLGLFVINRDQIGHAFDIDSLGIHVNLPPGSTTAVAIKPAGPGRLEFYCGIPGHRAGGMVGTIVVE